MTVVRIILVIAIGLGVDWAVFERLKMLLWPLGFRSEVRYRDLPPARLFVVIVASGAVGFSLTPTGPLPLSFWAGIAMFLLATCYAVFFAFRR
ncbi:hypothetical protein C8J44_2348 [Sphingomonas sp. PP-CE-3A-406]|nr:hypothetical protein C8J44_2348 [Sphingomonas sp. PP-CE-3A-406]